MLIQGKITTPIKQYWLKNMWTNWNGKSGETQEITMNVSESSDQCVVTLIKKPCKSVETEKVVETQCIKVSSDHCGVVNEEKCF